MVPALFCGARRLEPSAQVAYEPCRISGVLPGRVQRVAGGLGAAVGSSRSQILWSPIWEFPKIAGLFLSESEKQHVQYIRVYCGPLVFGNSHIAKLARLIRYSKWISKCCEQAYWLRYYLPRSNLPCQLLTGSRYAMGLIRNTSRTCEDTSVDSA